MQNEAWLHFLLSDAVFLLFKCSKALNRMHIAILWRLVDIPFVSPKCRYSHWNTIVTFLVKLVSYSWISSIFDKFNDLPSSGGHFSTEHELFSAWFFFISISMRFIHFYQFLANQFDLVQISMIPIVRIVIIFCAHTVSMCFVNILSSMRSDFRLSVCALDWEHLFNNFNVLLSHINYWLVKYLFY